MKKPAGIVTFLLLSIFQGLPSASGKGIVVSSPHELAAALGSAAPGDAIVLKNGDWKNVSLAIHAGGALDKPVEIRAETPGGVVLSGSSSLEIDAPYVVVSGLVFSHGSIDGDAVINLNSHHGVVRDTAIIDFNPASFKQGYYWVFFRGEHNLVDRCYFKGKSNMEPLIGNALEGSRYNSVTHCYIKDIPYNDANGREDVRVWGSGKYEQADNDGAFFSVEDNLFDHADGEGVEIISLKSNHNRVVNNTIVATRGGINIRRGNFNVVSGNIILAQGVETATGLRMTGQHNVVKGNYVFGCEYGIRVSCGEFVASALTSSYKPNIKPVGSKKNQARVPTYPQNVDDDIEDNVIVGSTGPDLDVGANYKRHWPQEQEILLPIRCMVKNNRFVRPQGGVSVVGTIPDTQPPLDRFMFEPNTYLANVIVGGTNAYAPSAQGFSLQALPEAWSVAREAAGLKPLTPGDVGPDWMKGAR